MPIRFGIFDHLEKRGVPLHQLYRERVEYAQCAERAGFWCYHKAEHHTTPLDGAPSGNMMLTAIAENTDRLRVSALVYLLPFHHPLRLLEEICMLDHLSEGRVEVGVGRGISPAEHVHWGIDPEQGRARSQEALDILLAGFTAEKLDFEGEFYRFEKVPIEVRPYQHPRPPLWYPGNPQYAGEHGLNTVMFGPAEAVRAAVDAFEKARKASSLEPINPGPLTVGASRHLYVAETDAKAEERARKAWARYTANLSKLFRDYGLPIPMDPTVGGDFDKARSVRAVVVGSPETVRQEVQHFQAVSRSDYYIGSFFWGDLDYAEATSSLDLFAKEVMPAFSS